MIKALEIQKKYDNFKIKVEGDLKKARIFVKSISQSLGFHIIDQTKLITAVSEILRNIIKYADGGLMILEEVKDSTMKGLKVIFIDEGPGITDVDLAMTDGYSTSNGLGKGLGGAKKLVDDFFITSEVGKGTEVRIIKWLR